MRDTSGQRLTAASAPQRAKSARRGPHSQRGPATGTRGSAARHKGALVLPTPRARAMSTSPVPARLRRQVDSWADEWLTTTFSRTIALRAQNPGPFNYPVAVFSEWRGKAFYLYVRYRSRSRKADDDFV